MKATNLVALLIGVGLLIGGAEFCLAQAAAEHQGNTAAAGAYSASSANSKTEAKNASTLESGTKIDAELESALDAKTAKPGDEVRARVTKKIKNNGDVVVNKGDHLIGKVTEAQAHANGKAGSQLNVVFDRLVTAQGETRLNAVLSSIVSTPSSERMQQESAPAPMMAPSMQGQARGGGGGLVGGVTSTAGSAVGAVAGGVSDSGATLSAATQSSVGAHSALGLSTPLREIHVQSDTKAENSTSSNSVISSKNGDLRLESGTRMQFRVAEASSGKSN